MWCNEYNHSVMVCLCNENRETNTWTQAEKTNSGETIMSELKAKEYKWFEDIKHVYADGSEYWLTRERRSERERTA